MIGASVLLLLLSFDGRLSRWDGAMLFTLLVIYIVWTIRESRKAVKVVKAEFAEQFGVKGQHHLSIQLAFLLAGLALLVVGAHFTVEGCVTIATWLGASELIIGLTVVAIGTSLPEVVTSVVASYRGERDIAVGNVIGSSMFNILAVLGLGSIVAPQGINVALEAIRFDIPVMIAVAVVCLPIFFVGHRIARWEGALLLGYYCTYVAYLILHATGNGLGRVLDVVMILFVIPLTVVTMLIAVYQYWRKQRASKANGN